jgi:SpoIID/LytB domain protein
MRRLFTYSIILFILLSLVPSKIEASVLTEEPKMQVKLVSYLGNKPSISLGVTGTYNVEGTSTQLTSDKKYTVKVEAGTYLSLFDGTSIIAAGDTIKISPVNEGDRALINNRPYLGSFDFTIENHLYVRPINKIGMEDYLKSVVPHEMYASWSREALKVQAVAARTYAYVRMNKIIDDSTTYQAYGGASNLHTNSNAAVEETAGEILVYNGRPIEAVYSASNGGMTESNSNEWGGTQLPYLPVQKDEFDTQKKWNITIQKQQINTAGLNLSLPDTWWNNTNEVDKTFTDNIKSWLNKNGYANKQLKIVSISNLDFYNQTSSGRAERADLSVQFFVKDQVDATGKLVLQTKDINYVTADTIRAFVGLSVMASTLISEETQTDSAYTISGSGYGHGVGMSQHGANNRANAGHLYKDILTFYYPGTAISKIYVEDATAPDAPTVNVVMENSTVVTGSAEEGSTVTVQAGTQVLGSAQSDNEGKFVVTIPPQSVGAELQVFATDKAGNNSASTIVIVQESLTPAPAKVNGVTQADNVVTGTAKPGTIVYVKVGSAVIGSGKVTAQGNFAIGIPKQPVSTKLGIVVRGTTGIFSGYTYVVVTEKAIPLAPQVNEITNQSTAVIGTAEPNSLVYVKVGSLVIGKGNPDHSGNFYIEIPVQSLGTEIRVVVRDGAGNFSPYTNVTVVEKTMPFAAKVNVVTDKSTTVTGLAEPNNTVTVKAGEEVIGTGIADAQGTYSIAILVQATGTKLGVVVSDEAGNLSLYTYMTVIEKTAPFAPKVDEVTNQAATVTGTTEATSVVYVKVGSVVIGKGKSKADGSFAIKIPVQEAGTILRVVVRDGEGNFSPYTLTIVTAVK